MLFFIRVALVMMSLHGNRTLTQEGSKDGQIEAGPRDSVINQDNGSRLSERNCLKK